MQFIFFKEEVHGYSSICIYALFTYLSVWV